jgi:predicted aldo/keto reductase-like oxidoreductase
VDGFRPIPAAWVKEIRESVKAAFNEMCTGCRYCDECPRGIPIPKFMDAYNHCMLFGKPVAMVNRLDWHWGIKPENDFLERCEECGACEELCTQRLPIMKRLKAIRKALDLHLKEEKKKQGK